jgi:hypothetical protein
MSMNALDLLVMRHPLLVSAIVWAALALAGRFVASRTVAGRLIASVSAAAIAVFLAMAWYYARTPQYFDVAEPTTTIVGWLYHLGQPIYHAQDAPARYSHVWGPIVFMVHGAVLGWLGPSIGVSKAIGCVAAVASLGLLVIAVRNVAGSRAAWIGTGLTALVFLVFRHYSFWTRPEPLELLCVAAGLAALSFPGAASLLVIGITQGLLWNLKLTGPLYAAPIFVWLLLRRGWRAAAGALALTVITAVAPFVLDPRVSWINYVSWFRVSARSGLEAGALTTNLEWSIWLLAPIGLAIAAARERARGSARLDWALVTLAGAMIGVSIAASKPGAGAYHLLPFVPIVAYAAATVLGHDARLAAPRWTIAAALALLLTASASAAWRQAAWVRTMTTRDTLHQMDDLQAFVRTHPGRTQMAYGRDEPATVERPVLVFAGGTYLIDQPAVREHQLNGVEIPEATVNAIRSCAADYFLVPQGDAPWSGVNVYPAVAGRPLYPDAMRAAFSEAYVLAGKTAYFDVWQCRTRR